MENRPETIRHFFDLAKTRPQKLDGLKLEAMLRDEI